MRNLETGNVAVPQIRRLQIPFIAPGEGRRRPGIDSHYVLQARHCSVSEDAVPLGTDASAKEERPCLG